MPGYEVIGPEERDEVLDVFNHGGVLFRHGFEAVRNGCFKVRDFEQAFGTHFGGRHCLAVSSGTAALRIALAALGIGPGDEVITQSFTFVATVEAIIEAGAQPVIAEIDATLNIDPVDVATKISPSTRAIIAVHMLGTPARLDEISDLCDQTGISLIEDVAWGCGGAFRGRPLGTWGSVGTFSFDHAKAITTGEGGMLIAGDHEIYLRAKAWHDHGHENNPDLPRWEDSRSSSGFNFRMSELQGAVGLAQLRKLTAIIEGQRSSHESMWRELKSVPGLTLRPSPPDSFETNDALVFSTPSKEAAIACRRELLEEGLSTKILPEATTWHFARHWDHMPQLMNRHGNLANAFPVSTSILERCVSLPVNVSMSSDVPKKARKAVARALGVQ